MGNCPPPTTKQLQAQPDNLARGTASRRAGKQARNVRVMSWNAGHVGQQQWGELKTWLASDAKHYCDVLIMQETHWKSSSEFTVSGWYCISSASQEPDLGVVPPKGRRRSRKDNTQGPSTTRADGVMVFLSPTFDKKKIRWKEWSPGRVLEVRADWQGSRITIASVYQHAWSAAKTIQANKDDRAQVLSALSKLVKQVPKRDSLVIAGDFNVSVSPVPGLIGPCVVEPQEPRPDEAHFTNLLSKLRLVALNTWHASPAHTFCQGEIQTQIDFILTKEPSAGGLAKRAAPTQHLGLGSWKKGGHLPMLATIPLMRHWLLPKGKPAPLQYDAAALQASVRATDDQAQAMRHWVQQSIHTCRTPHDWNALLLQASEKFFPLQRKVRPIPLEGVTRRMWRSRRALDPAAPAATETPSAQLLEGNEAQPASSMDVNPSSTQMPTDGAEHLLAHVAHAQAVKDSQKARISRFLAEVDESLAEGNQHVAFKTLKLLQPWKPPTRAQLKTKDGHLLGPQQELEVLKTYASRVFGAHAPLLPMSGPLPALPLSDLDEHIHSIKPGKAVPEGSAPAAAWRLCSSEIAQVLQPHIQQRTAEEGLEADLINADLCLIPKPGKPPDKPENLRPLGILRPDAKGLAGAVRSALQPHVMASLRYLPQFAYLPQRGLADALERVTHHLREARQLIQQSQPSRHELQEGVKAPGLVGGLTFALDLSQAFDTVSRQDILSLLQQEGVDGDTVRLVHSLHDQSGYRLKTQGATTTVETTAGIKQGCKLAPTLFSLLTGSLFRLLSDTCGQDQVLRYLTGYADDITLHRTIRSQADLRSAHAMIASLLEAVREHRLVVNTSKCVILVKLAGREAPSVISKHSCWIINTKGVQVPGWRLGPNKTFPAFEWVPSTKYLGVVISYAHFELQTLQFRIGEAKQKLHLVRKFVFNRRVASTKARLKVWTSTVQSTLMSGLAEVGISEESAQALRSWHAKKVRAVLNMPAHLTKVSTADVFQLHGIQDPVLDLRQRLQRRLRKLMRKAAGAPDITTHDAIFREIRTKVAAIDSLPRDVPEVAEQIPCSHCNAAFDTQRGLHLHCCRLHRDTVSRFIPSRFDRLKHAVDGMPQCAACQTKFRQWKGLRDHLLSGACPAPQTLQGLLETDARSTNPEVVVLDRLRREVPEVPRCKLGTLARQAHAAVLNRRCLVCNFWTPDRTKIKSHFHQAHRHDWERLHTAAVRVCQGHSPQLVKGLACPFCGYKVYDRRKHPEQCPVLYQLAVQWLRANKEQNQLSEAQPVAQPQCSASGTAYSRPQSVSPTTPLHRYFVSQAAPSSSLSRDRTPQTEARMKLACPSMRVLTNTSNSCYANSLAVALAAISRQGYDLGALQPVVDIITDPADGRPLSLFGLFEFRHLLSGWRLDGRQHDAAEFLHHLSRWPLGSAQPVPWQGRTDGQVEISDTGATPLYLPLPSGARTSLAGCMELWSESGFQRGLLWHPEILAVVLGRWQGAVKNSAPCIWRQTIQVPAWTDGQRRSYQPYRVSSGTFHLGQDLTSGHYRAFWEQSSPDPSNPEVWLSDDFQSPQLASPAMLATVEREFYLLFLVRIHDA